MKPHWAPVKILFPLAFKIRINTSLRSLSIFFFSKKTEFSSLVFPHKTKMQKTPHVLAFQDDYQSRNLSMTWFPSSSNKADSSTDINLDKRLIRKDLSKYNSICPPANSNMKSNLYLTTSQHKHEKHSSPNQTVRRYLFSWTYSNLNSYVLTASFYYNQMAHQPLKLEVISHQLNFCSKIPILQFTASCIGLTNFTSLFMASYLGCTDKPRFTAHEKHITRSSLLSADQRTQFTKAATAVLT